MQIVGDLHIHSKYSSGASRNIDIFGLALNSAKKGLKILGTGDCLHPSWLHKLRIELTEYTDGFYFLEKVPTVHFVLQSEIELIWKHNGLLKRVHFILLFPNFEKLDESYIFLSRYGNLSLNGRPKIYCSVESIIYGLKTIDSSIEIIPAHIFTPFFGIFGEKLLFKNLKEALGESMSLIYAIETGLSADPMMVRSISELNNLTIISNSDCHSTCFHRLGREANVFDLNKSNYRNLIESIRKSKIVKTYEVKPSAGKYYYDGHRKERHDNKLNYVCSPLLNIKDCPHCNKPLTKGVLSRVLGLQDQKSFNNLTFQYIVPLLSLISIICGGTEYDKRNLLLYDKLTTNNGGEYKIWEGYSNFRDLPDDLIAAIDKIRKKNFWFIPGYDSIYGKLQFSI